jgi:hypothetical protein
VVVTRRNYRELSVHPASVWAARRHVERVLAGWGRTDLIDDGELVVSELVSNALKATLGEYDTPVRDSAGRGGAGRGGAGRAGAGGDGAGGDGAGGDGAGGDGAGGDGAGGDGAGGDGVEDEDAVVFGVFAGVDRHVWVGLHQVRDGVVLEVWDRSRLPPRLTVAGEDDVGGRGLRLVDAVCAGWGYRWPRTGGKIVWAVLGGPA